eukprot:381547-Rhodomonas_salina.1
MEEEEEGGEEEGQKRSRQKRRRMRSVRRAEASDLMDTKAVLGSEVWKMIAEVNEEEEEKKAEEEEEKEPRSGADAPLGERGGAMGYGGGNG